MYYGVQYYPEQWPEERWEEDARLMAEAGVNGVRMGEFAWSAYEPRPGEYRFDWMERAVALLSRHGIRTLLCTCSRTPPPWVFRGNPGITNVNIQGLRETYGARYTYCPSNRIFHELAMEIDTRVIERFADNPGIIGWQIDNEIGGSNDCYCDTCLQGFRDYLRGKYGTTDELNRRWGEHFWSFRFESFDEVPMVRTRWPSPQLALEYRRYQSSLNCRFAEERAALIRRCDPEKLVTTNFQSAFIAHTDYNAMARHLDVNGCNYYPFRSPELLLDYYRGDRGKFFVLEQFTRLENVDSGPGWMRLWAWTAIAHGAKAINFFRWRVARQGQEMHADGILPQSGKPARRYAELAAMGAEVAKAAGALDGAEPRGEAAVVYSYESRWAVGSSSIKDFETVGEAVAFHEALGEANIPTDAGDPRMDLSRYRLVVAPRGFLLDAAAAENLAGYADRGGILVLTAATGVVDEYGRCFDTPRPGPLAAAAGIEVSDLADLDGPLSLEGTASGLEGWHGTGGTAADEIHPASAEVVAVYSSGWRKGLPAVTMNRFGKGKVIYLGTVLAGESMGGFTAFLRRTAGLVPVLDTPPGVRALRQYGDGYELLFLTNRTDSEVGVPLDGPWEDLLAGGITDMVVLHPVSTAVLKREV